MIIELEDEEEKSDAAALNYNPWVQPVDPQERLTLAEICFLSAKLFVRRHKTPHPIKFYWNERDKKLLEETYLPEALINIITSYEVSST